MSDETKIMGRPPKPVHLKKKNYSVALKPSEAQELIDKYGSLTLALRSVLISDKPNLITLLEQAIIAAKQSTEFLTELKSIVN